MEVNPDSGPPHNPGTEVTDTIVSKERSFVAQAAEYTGRLLREKQSMLTNAYAATLVGYTALRTVAVGEGLGPHSHADWRVFLAIELATTRPLARSNVTLASSIANPDKYTVGDRIRAACISASTLAAPYTYVGVANGHNMPPGAWGGMGAFMLVSLTSIWMGISKARKTGRTDAEVSKR